MDTVELTTEVGVSLGELFSLLTGPEVAQAVTTTLRELGWELPTSVQKQMFWLVKRTERHCIDILRKGSANKFQYKQVHLEHRFVHFSKMIESLDAEFKTAVEDDPTLFSSANPVDLFGSYTGSNFKYDIIGNDITGLKEV